MPYRMYQTKMVGMNLAPHKFNRLEAAGSLGDLGTLIPLGLALIAVTGLSFSAVFLAVGLFYIGAGLYFRLPLPVQPLKVVAALAVAFPDKVSPEIISAAALLFSGVLFFLAFSGLIDKLAKLFSKPVVRGIQLGLGLILAKKALALIMGPELIGQGYNLAPQVFGLSVNLIVGLVGVFFTLLLLGSSKYPAALVLVGGGLVVGLVAVLIGQGRLPGLGVGFGPTEIKLTLPGWSDFGTAFLFLVLPQIPLTIGNAVIATKDAARSLFPEDQTARTTDKSLSLSMALANLVVGLIGAAPLCHGAGGLAAHHRFGARTGGSNLIIGAAFVVLALVLGRMGLDLLAVVPRAVLGVLLLFASLELGLLIRDVKERNDLFICLLIASLAAATTDMFLAFAAGLAVKWLTDRLGVRI